MGRNRRKGEFVGFRSGLCGQQGKITEYLGVDLSKRDVVLFGEPFAIFIFGCRFDKRTVEIPAFRLDRAPLRFDLYKISTQLDPICRRESDTECRGFCKE